MKLSLLATCIAMQYGRAVATSGGRVRVYARLGLLGSLGGRGGGRPFRGTAG